MFQLLLCILITIHTVKSQSPEIIQTPQNVSVCEGRTVTFTCVVMWPNGSDPIGGATWVTGVGFGAATDLVNHMSSNDVGGRTSPANVTSTLTVTNVSASGNGRDYRCQQVDRTDPVYLNVFTPPDPPTIRVTAPISSQSFTVNWTPSDPTYSYTVIWTNLNNDQIRNKTAEENTNSDEVTGLTGFDNYIVRVAAMNTCGMMTSNVVTVYGPPGMPMNAMVIENRTTSESFVVTWDDVNDPFDVTYVVIWTDGNTVMSNTTTDTSYTVTGLTNSTTYDVTVTANNTCCGAGPTTPPFQAVTNELPPTDPPTDPSTDPTGGSSDSDSTGAIVGGVVGGIVAVAVIIVIIIVVYIFLIHPKGESDSDKKALKMSSPTNTGAGGRATVTPQSNLQSGPTEVYADVHKPVPHQTAATGEEYAVSNKKPKPKGPTEEYAQIDKSKKSGQQGIQYADLADLPQSTSDPSAKGPTSMYAQVA